MQLLHYCFEQKYYFGQKALIFLQKIVTSAKLREPWYLKVYFRKLKICVYLHAKFEISSIILTRFRQGVTNL